MRHWRVCNLNLMFLFAVAVVAQLPCESWHVTSRVCWCGAEQMQLMWFQSRPARVDATPCWAGCSGSFLELWTISVSERSMELLAEAVDTPDAKSSEDGEARLVQRRGILFQSSMSTQASSQPSPLVRIWI